jgi:transmembrane sensor
MSERDRIAELGREVRAEQDRALDTMAPLEGLGERIAARAPFRRTSSRGQKLGMWAAAAAVSIAAVAAVRQLQQPELAVHAHGREVLLGEWIAAPAGGVPLAFSDGSELSLAEGTRARMAEIGADGAHVVVESGRVSAHVTKRSDARWRLSFGPFDVNVTGTRFDVDWNAERQELSVVLREGSVMVGGCVLGDGRPVTAGETLRASCAERRYEVRPSSAPALAKVEPKRDAASDAPKNEPSEALPRSVPAAPAAPTWQALARAGKFSEALAGARARGFAAECASSSEAELRLLADTARLAGDARGAVQAFSALRRRFPGGAHSAFAAFELGRLHFDQLGAYDEAVRWLNTYLSEQPSGRLAREALGRLMEAETKSGNASGARRTAELYLSRYPSGPHQKLARSLSAR